MSIKDLLLEQLLFLVREKSTNTTITMEGKGMKGIAMRIMIIKNTIMITMMIMNIAMIMIDRTIVIYL